MAEGTTDLVVVGAGTAGMPCAITAADNGAHVVVVEKAAEVGGTLHVSGGYMNAAGTRRQRDFGIVDSPENHYADVMKAGGGTASPLLLRTVVEQAASTVDWFHDLGFPFAAGVGATPGGYGAADLGLLRNGVGEQGLLGAKPNRTARRLARSYVGPEMGRSILKLLLSLWDAHVEAGRIVLLAGHSLDDLLVENGRVAGVHATGPNGPCEVRGAAVVLATGGYASNPELFSELEPHTERLVAVARRNSRGDGLLAARRLGAAVRTGDSFHPDGEPAAGGDREQPGFARVNVAERLPREIHVNSYGQRFRAEDDPDMDELETVLLRQPFHQMWIVFDEAALTAGDSFHVSWDEAQIRRRAAEGKIAWIADDILSLAEKAGIDGEGLSATVETWNAAVRRGEDPLGRRHIRHPVATPPFYAASTYATLGPTVGGLVVDAELRVVDEQGVPLPGLYAIGEILGSGATMGYRKTSGMMVTSALTLGRFLGRRLAVDLAATVPEPASR